METVTITLKEFEALKRDSIKLELLENAGVDSWSFYGDALEGYYDRLEEEGL